MVEERQGTVGIMKEGFLKIVFFNKSQLSIYCVQSTKLAPKGFRHESDPMNSGKGHRHEGTQQGRVGCVELPLQIWNILLLLQ